jgi:epoxyqueuosine reductase
MSEADLSAASKQIIRTAISLGASLAGIASLDLLKKSPSHDIYAKIEPNLGTGSRDFVEGVEPGVINWPHSAKSALVIALTHKEDTPEMDWWIEQGDDRESPGCRMLQDILNNVGEWVQKEFSFTTHALPYHLERGGIFFKDAGVLAGLGSIGKNNLLVTPEYGPRIRVWALLFDAALKPTGPVIYDPCDGCDEPCRKACPRNAFGKAAHSPVEMGMVTLPGKNGYYDRETCRLETEKNVADKEAIELDGYEGKGVAIKFCRICELSCPVGKE